MEQLSADWLKRARNGDAEAFAAAFESLRGTVYAVAFRLVGESDADDVVMETYLRAWQAIGRFDVRSSLKSWLYRIAHNCAIDMLRKRQRRRELLPTPDEDGQSPIERLPDETTPHPASQLEGAELRQRLDHALAQLPDEQRLILLLRYSDGLSYREIAAAAGVPIGTVMSRLFNGRRKLRQIVGVVPQQEDGV